MPAPTPIVNDDDMNLGGVVLNVLQTRPAEESIRILLMCMAEIIARASCRPDPTVIAERIDAIVEAWTSTLRKAVPLQR